MSQEPNILAVLLCGHTIGVTSVDYKGKERAKAIDDWIKAGASLERVSTEEVKRRWKRCDCPSAQLSLF